MQPVLTTSRMLLRPLESTDAARVQDLAGAKEVAVGTLTVPHPYEDGVAEEWIAGRAEAWERRELLVFAQTTPEDGLVGVVGLEFDMPHQRAELGYWVGVPYWGRGYATEAARAVVGYAFAELGLRRVVAQHYARNPASGRVLEKVGMRREGLLRSHLIRFGKAEDSVLYGILADEWPAETGSGTEGCRP